MNQRLIKEEGNISGTSGRCLLVTAEKEDRNQLIRADYNQAESLLGMRKIEKITSSSYKQEVESSQKNKRLGATNLFFFLLRAS